MSKIKVWDEINQDRRRFFGTAAMTVAAAQFGIIGPADAQSGKAKPAQLPPVKPGRTRPLLRRNRSMLASSTSATLKPALLVGHQSFSSMAGPTTFTALSMSLPCLPRRALG